MRNLIRGSLYPGALNERRRGTASRLSQLATSSPDAAARIGQSYRGAAVGQLPRVTSQADAFGGVEGPETGVNVIGRLGERAHLQDVKSQRAEVQTQIDRIEQEREAQRAQGVPESELTPLPTLPTLPSLDTQGRTIPNEGAGTRQFFGGVGTPSGFGQERVQKIGRLGDRSALQDINRLNALAGDSTLAQQWNPTINQLNTLGGQYTSALQAYRDTGVETPQFVNSMRNYWDALATTQLPPNASSEIKILQSMAQQNAPGAIPLASTFTQARGASPDRFGYGRYSPLSLSALPSGTEYDVNRFGRQYIDNLIAAGKMRSDYGRSSGDLTERYEDDEGPMSYNFGGLGRGTMEGYNPRDWSRNYTQAVADPWGGDAINRYWWWQSDQGKSRLLAPDAPAVVQGYGDRYLGGSGYRDPQSEMYPGSTTYSIEEERPETLPEGPARQRLDRRARQTPVGSYTTGGGTGVPLVGQRPAGFSMKDEYERPSIPLYGTQLDYETYKIRRGPDDLTTFSRNNMAPEPNIYGPTSDVPFRSYYSPTGARNLKVDDDSVGNPWGAYADGSVVLDSGRIGGESYDLWDPNFQGGAFVVNTPIRAPFHQGGGSLAVHANNPALLGTKFWGGSATPDTWESMFNRLGNTRYDWRGFRTPTNANRDRWWALADQDFGPRTPGFQTQPVWNIPMNQVAPANEPGWPIIEFNALPGTYSVAR